MRSLRVAVWAVVLAALTGCSLQMGNTKAGLLEGWNQPTQTTVDKTTTTSAPVQSQK